MIISGLIIFIAAAYLMGSMPTAYLFGRYLQGVDIRAFGSGNVGATNAMRLLGRVPGIMVLVIDILKGLLAVTLMADLAAKMMPDTALNLIRAILGFAVVSGHNWTVFLRFKGGKGVATSAGVMVGITPLFFGLGMVVFTIVLLAGKYVSLASICAAISIPVLMLLFNQPAEFIILSVLLSILIVFRHKDNIKRLLRGDERKVFKKW